MAAVTASVAAVTASVAAVIVYCASTGFNFVAPATTVAAMSLFAVGESGMVIWYLRPEFKKSGPSPDGLACRRSRGIGGIGVSKPGIESFASLVDQVDPPDTRTQYHGARYRHDPAGCGQSDLAQAGDLNRPRVGKSAQYGRTTDQHGQERGFAPSCGRWHGGIVPPPGIRKSGPHAAYRLFAAREAVLATRASRKAAMSLSRAAMSLLSSRNS